MQSTERISGLLRSPQLVWDAILHGRYRFVYDQMPLTASRMSLRRRLNLLKAGFNLVYRRSRPWNIPLHLQIETVNYCNLACPVCPAGIRAIKRKPLAIDPGLVEKVINETGPYLLTVSLWAWGEPLLHPGLRDILKLVRKHDIAVLLSTNGQCLGNEGVIEALTSEPPTHLIVSIDGLTDETNSQYRIGAKLSRVLSGVRRITEIKESKKQSLPVLQMRFIVMRHNQHEVPRVIDFARRHRFDLLTFRTLSTVDSDVANRTHRDLVPDDPRFTGFTPDSGGPPPRRRFVCHMPFWFPTLFADGTVVACEQDYNAQEPLGVVSQQVSFTDVWFSKRAARVRTAIRDHAQQFTFCRNCPYKNRQSTDASFSMQLLNKQVDFSHWR